MNAASRLIVSMSELKTEGSPAARLMAA